jgi:hypothetical protein
MTIDHQISHEVVSTVSTEQPTLRHLIDKTTDVFLQNQGSALIIASGSVQREILSQIQPQGVVHSTDNLSFRQTSVRMKVSYQVQPTGESYVDLRGDFSEQTLNGCIAIGTIVAVTVLIRALTPLIKVCRP